MLLIKKFVFAIFNYINNLLQIEYHQIFSWFFVGFIFGISLFLDNPNKNIFIILISTLLFIKIILKEWVYLKLWIINILLGLIIGNLTILVRLNTISHINLPYKIHSNISGSIINIKPFSNEKLELTLNKIFIKNIPSYQTPNKIKIYIPNNAMNLKLLIGDNIETVATLNPIKNNKIIPYGYNFGRQNYFADVGATGFTINPITVINNHSKKLSIQSIRHAMYNRICSLSPPIIANFIAALMLGESKGIDTTILQNIRYAGVSHILCVSGLHLSLIAFSSFKAFNLFLNMFDIIAFNFNIKKTSAILSLITSFIYWLLSGQQVASTRAFIMTSIYITSIIINRKPDLLRTLCISAFIILLFNPEDLFHPSFQLSFIAVLSLISGFKLHTPYFPINNYFISKIFNLIILNIYTSFLAGIITLPIAVKHFYTSANYLILSNLIIVPLISSLVMPIILISIILINTPLIKFNFLLLEKLINIILNFSSYIAQAPKAVGYMGYITDTCNIIYIISLFWISIWQTKLRSLGLVGIILFCVLFLIRKTPDLIISNDIKAIGIKNYKGQLEIYSDNISNFKKQYWSNWFGQKEIIHNDINIKQHNWDIITKDKSKIHIIISNFFCPKANIIINLVNNKKCKNVPTITKRRIKNLNSDRLIYCTNTKCYTLPK